MEKDPKDPKIGQKFEPAKETGWEINLGEEIKRKREDTASLLAKIVVGTFASLSIFATILLFTTEYSQEVLDCINIILPPFATLIGVVFGFYFSQSRIK